MTKGEMVQQPESRFIRIKCLECENEQVIFSHASTEIKCMKCQKILARPTGGRARLDPNAREIEILP